MNVQAQLACLLIIDIGFFYRMKDVLSRLGGVCGSLRSCRTVKKIFKSVLPEYKKKINKLNASNKKDEKKRRT